MASYTKRNDKWTVRFRVIINGQNINKRLGGFKTKKEAIDAYKKYALQNTSSDTTADMTFVQLFELYLEFKLTRVKDGTYIQARQLLRDYVLPYFSNIKIRDITTKNIISWQDKINTTNLAFKTKSCIYINFVTMIDFAINHYNLPLNIVSKVGNFKNSEPKKQIDFWTPAEFEQFISVANCIVYKTFFSFLYLTGARKGEALALLWQDVDFENAVITIAKTLSYKNVSNGYKITAPKTNTSNRRIAIPQILVTLLLNLKDYYKQNKSFTENAFVFGISRPLPTTEIDRKRDKYCKIANVKHIRIHDIRHSHASLLINKGQNILLVAHRLGHSDIDMTLNTYSHLFPSKEKELINSLDIKI